MAWIEYHTALRDHWKIKRLATILEVDYLYALGAISCLWLWVAEYSPNGDIKRFSDAEIRDAARCNLQKFTFEALKKCELVNEKGKINDWSKHGLKLLESNRKRVKEYRERLHNSNVTDTPTNLTNHTIPNQPNQHKYLEDKNFVKVFKDYLEMRKKIHKPATERAKELVLRELHRYDLETAIKMLEQSIVGSWQGVFPLKTANIKSNTQSPFVSLTEDAIHQALGNIATKDMIKGFLRDLPETLWPRVANFLRRRYPEDGDKSYSEAERELIAEIREANGKITALTKGIGNER